MYTIKRGEDFAWVFVQVVDATGSPVDADAIPVGTVYRDVSGVPTVETEILTGSITLTKLTGVDGYYYQALPIGLTAPIGRYAVRITYDVSAVPGVQIFEFEIVEETSSLSNSLSSIG